MKVHEDIKQERIGLLLVLFFAIEFFHVLLVECAQFVDYVARSF